MYPGYGTKKDMYNNYMPRGALLESWKKILQKLFGAKI